MKIFRLRVVVAAVAVLVGTGTSVAALAPEEARVADWVDTQTDAVARDLEAAVRIDSVTGNLAGVRLQGEQFARQLEALGFEARFEPLPASSGRAGHLVAEHRGKHGKRVLLIGHLDTVFPGGAFRREGDIVHGSGVADMKGGDIVLLTALRGLHAAGLLQDANLTVVMTGDEESLGKPHELARRTLLDAAARCDVALAFESAIGLTATVARRGSISWELVVQGASGHSSLIFSPLMGDGAAFEMTRILQEFRREVTTLDGATINVALLVAGTEAQLAEGHAQASGKTNVIPQRAIVRGDLRTVSAEQLATAQDRMRAVVAKNLPRTSAELRFFEGYPAMAPRAENYALLAQFDAVSRDLGLGAITAFDPRGRGAGDIAFVSPPLPGLDGLGLDGPGQHTANESADLTQAPALIKRAAVMIHRLTAEQR